MVILFPVLGFFILMFSVLVQVGAPARVGLVAPIDVIVPPGNTGLDPSQTSFFQVCEFDYLVIFFYGWTLRF